MQYDSKIAVLVLLAASPIASSQAASTFRLGTNLAEFTDYSSAIPFIDLFKQGREWFAGAITWANEALLGNDRIAVRHPDELSRNFRLIHSSPTW